MKIEISKLTAKMYARDTKPMWVYTRQGIAYLRMLGENEHRCVAMLTLTGDTRGTVLFVHPGWSFVPVGSLKVTL